LAKVILLDSPSWLLFNPRQFLHLGILYLAASLRTAGHDVKVMDCHAITTWDDVNKSMLINTAMLEPCDVLGISATTANVHWGQQLAKAWPAKFKVLGGSHATYILNGPHEQFKKPGYFKGFDCVMLGEAEESFRIFCNTLDFFAVPGLAWFEGETLHRNFSAALPDVTKLPIPAFDLWPGGFGGGGLSVTSARGNRNLNEAMTASLYTARGCPYGCRFCADARTKVREETDAQLISECEMLAGLGVTCIRVQDDVLTLKDDHCRRIADILHDHGMSWRGNTRVNLTDPGLFKYMAARGCVELGFGCEHGSAKMLKLMDKGTTPEKNTEGIKMCQDAGMVAKAFLMLGFPGETLETIEEMKEWVLKTRPDMASVCLFQPFPGCDVWNRPEAYGVKLPDAPFENFWQQGLDDDPRALVLDLPSITKEELVVARKEFGEFIDREVGHRDRRRVDCGKPGLGTFIRGQREDLDLHTDHRA
jgi:anaerobic magnesium-protoporphyrin IX monomethyl ester cyclase